LSANKQTWLGNEPNVNTAIESAIKNARAEKKPRVKVRSSNKLKVARALD
jgi:hypothetical protein